MTSTSRRVQLILASTVVALGLGFTAPAFAQTGPVSSASSGTVIPPEVEDTIVTPPPVTVTTVPAGGTVPPEVLDEVVTNDNLAFTGTDAAGLSLLGLGAIALGGSLLAVKRRREANA